MPGLVLHGTFGYTLSGHTESEIGYFHFEPGGSVSGGMRNGASPDDVQLASFTGHYTFNGPQIGPGGKVVPLGVITVQATHDPEKNWDYSFIVIDDAEMMLTSSNGMSGSMKRIHAPILTPGGTGSRK